MLVVEAGRRPRRTLGRLGQTVELRIAYRLPVDGQRHGLTEPEVPERLPLPFRLRPLRVNTLEQVETDRVEASIRPVPVKNTVAAGLVLGHDLFIHVFAHRSAGDRELTGLDAVYQHVPRLLHVVYPVNVRQLVAPLVHRPEVRVPVCVMRRLHLVRAVYPRPDARTLRVVRVYQHLVQHDVTVDLPALHLCLLCRRIANIRARVEAPQVVCGRETDSRGPRCGQSSDEQSVRVRQFIAQARGSQVIEIGHLRLQLRPGERDHEAVRIDGDPLPRLGAHNVHAYHGELAADLFAGADRDVLDGFGDGHPEFRVEWTLPPRLLIDLEQPDPAGDAGGPHERPQIAEKFVVCLVPPPVGHVDRGVRLAVGPLHSVAEVERESRVPVLRLRPGCFRFLRHLRKPQGLHIVRQTHLVGLGDMRHDRIALG